MNKVTYYLLAMSVLSTPLLAEGDDLFRSGQSFIELSGGGGTATSPAIDMYKKDPSLQLHSLIMLSSPLPQDKMLGIIEMNAPEPTVEARNYRVEYEYAVLDWLGLGGSVNSSAITLKNAPVGGDLMLMTLFMPVQITGQIPDFAKFIIATSRADIEMEKLNTADFNMGFHFPGNSSIDPFFKLGIGVGSVAGGNIVKESGMLGVRVGLASHFHLLFDVYANNFNVTWKKVGTAQVTETGGHFGIGTSF